jgi:uncharacterized protein
MDQDEHRYQEEVKTIIMQSSRLMNVLDKAQTLDLPDWYVAGGAIFQTVWNNKHGFDLDQGIADYDLVYFDHDTSYEAEDVYIKRAKEVFGTLPVEVRNQARVHLWFKSHFGRNIEPALSTEHAISQWMCPCTTLGARLENDDALTIFAAQGLSDLFTLAVRPNKHPSLSQHIYEKKITRWKQHWPLLTIEPW